MIQAEGMLKEPPDLGPALGLPRAAYTALALLWPFLRLALELDAASAGMRSDRVALVARNRAASA
jgi:hypothetical protein